MSKIKPVPFYYIRHGQTDWNLENRVMGRRDIPLNEKGINQALSARNHLLGCGIKTICHSPLLRARMTAEIFNEVLQCELVSIDDLQEFDLGSSSGQIIGPWIDEWRLGEKLSGGETYDAFKERCINGINQSPRLSFCSMFAPIVIARV
ncbi:MAG: hypothetical protein A3E80_06480 [Chlamydiae bacterium RIFCSPHIGHO2_12_FULL_49_9]|nr:MAG: hypothetical protein A3E80_06480 [Chlamydiae bacterium RIFCSPHIGHO2_12_FULL_49_9]HLB52441.1 histidine phosphatase family protein [Chlamydiales bacterium]